MANSNNSANNIPTPQEATTNNTNTTNPGMTDTANSPAPNADPASTPAVAPADLITPLGFEMGVAKDYPDAHQAATALIQLKTTLLGANFTVASEEVNGTHKTVTCTFENNGTTVRTIQNVKTLSLTVVQ